MGKVLPMPIPDQVIDFFDTLFTRFFTQAFEADLTVSDSDGDV